MKKYWKSLDELHNTPEIQRIKENEFSEPLPVEDILSKNSLGDVTSTRRDFLKLMGFSVSAAALSACEAPVVKSIPYLIKPENIIPGVATWYASTYFDGSDYCPVLVKTREGRPIKVEGNPQSKYCRGAINARVQASVLSLYDTARLKHPLKNNQQVRWEEVDQEIITQLSSISAKGGKIRLVTSSLASPSLKKIIDEFSALFTPKSPEGDLNSHPSGGRGVNSEGNFKHIVYDAVSYAAIIKANEKFFGKAVVPVYQFDNADVVVGIGADFLGNWLSPIEFSMQYGKARKVKRGGNKMLKHIQYETVLSLTGCNADERIAIKPSQTGALLMNLYNLIAKETGSALLKEIKVGFSEKVQRTASALLNNRGKSLIVTGTNDISHQLLTNAINRMLGNYGNTIDINDSNLTVQSDDSGFNGLVEEMKKGEVNAVILLNVNPGYSHPRGEEFKELLKKVELSVSLCDRLDETSSAVKFACPVHHFLESWGDGSPRKGFFGLSQPAISPLFSTRSPQDCLLKWISKDISYYDYLKNFWRENIFPLQTNIAFFDKFWDKSLHDGFFETGNAGAHAQPLPSENMAALLTEAVEKIEKAGTTETRLEVVFYQKTGIGNGSHANNPWLQEMPDPVSKVCWDNYLTMSPGQMEEMNLHTHLGQQEQADVVELNVNGKTVKTPVFPLPGQKYGTVGIALGYGRTAAGKVGDNLGINAYPLLSFSDGTLHYEAFSASVTQPVAKYNLATTQTHQTMMGRDIVRETTIEDYSKNPKSGNEEVTIKMHGGENLPPAMVNMWKNHEKNDQWWNLSIDLTACIGCGACTVSCTAENNIPVVGKDEINRSRDMQWIRIDRYFSTDAAENDLKGMEKPSGEETLEVAFQPVMCQHCNHAPCETVCPVAATTHSSDGLNMMAYNRCVGTRYCANNCPYKVRRFNWFEYDKLDKFKDVNPSQDDMGRMVLNPDVIVRSRGVMEKCTMCYQRIQEGKLRAKSEGRPLKDGEIHTACEAVCPTKAITFGNVKDELSEVAKAADDERKYYLIEELDTQPSVFYLTKIRNKA